MKIARNFRKSARIEMIPLIDVIFLLLITFIFFSMSMKTYRNIPVNLPGSSTAAVEKSDFAEISIQENGNIFFNKKKVSISEIYSILETWHRNFPLNSLLISGDKKAPYEKIVYILDCARESKIQHISLNTQWQ